MAHELSTAQARSRNLTSFAQLAGELADHLSEGDSKMPKTVSSGSFAINANAQADAKAMKRIEEPRVRKNVPLSHGDKYFVPSSVVYLGDPNMDDHLVLTVHGLQNSRPGESIPAWPSVVSLREANLPERLSFECKQYTPKKNRRWLSLSDVPLPEWKASHLSELFTLMNRLGKK